MTDEIENKDPTPMSDEQHEVSEDGPVEEKDVDDGIPKEYSPVITELTDALKEIPESLALAFFKTDPEKVIEQLNKVKTNKLPGDKSENDRYIEIIKRAFQNHPAADSNVSPFEREDAKWAQALHHDGEAIGANRPRWDLSKGRLTGTAAEIRVQAAMGLGSIVNVPLWHTGIWVKMKAPSDSALLEVERRMGQEKIDLGRATNGVSFSNTSVYIINHLTTLLLSRIYESTYVDTNINALKKVIKITDIPQLVWGGACAIYPHGFRLAQPCVSNPMECKHVDEGKINLGRLSWVDNRSLNTYQSNLMSDRDGETTNEMLAEYNRNHVAPQSKLVKISDEISIRLEVPTIAQYEKAGFEWIDSIIQMTDEAFDRSLRGDERNEYITRQAAVVSLRRYNHWITKIQFSDDSTIDSSESINSVLGDLSSDKTIRVKIEEEIEQFIRNSIISAIGIPKYNCPKCDGEPDEDSIPKNLQEIIQLEVVETFFTLASIKVLLAMEL